MVCGITDIEEQCCSHMDDFQLVGVILGILQFYLALILGIQKHTMSS